jgi:hypothetical protein
MAQRKKATNRYAAIIEKIFFSKYEPGLDDIPFERDDMQKMAKSLRIKLPKNLGDIIYSSRYRTSMPDRIIATQPEGKEWIIGAAVSHFTALSLSL